MKYAFVPVDDDLEKTPVDDENLARIAELETELANAKTRIEELEAQPAAPSATEEFERVNKIEKTGNRGLDNLTRILNA